MSGGTERRDIAESNIELPGAFDVLVHSSPNQRQRYVCIRKEMATHPSGIFVKYSRIFPIRRRNNEPRVVGYFSSDLGGIGADFDKMKVLTVSR